MDNFHCLLIGSKYEELSRIAHAVEPPAELWCSDARSDPHVRSRLARVPVVNNR